MDASQDSRLREEIMKWDNFYAADLYKKSARINPYPRINDRMGEAIRESYSLMEKRDEFQDLYNVFNRYWLQESIGRYFRFMKKPAGKKAEWKRVEYREPDILKKFDDIKRAVKEWHEEAAEHNGENTSGMLSVKLHKTPTLDKSGMTFEAGPKDILEYVRPYLH